MKEIFPHSGASHGGTQVQVAGAWFKHRPQYGLIPYCKFGEKIVRGRFISTVRIVCEAPPKEGRGDRVRFEVSQNGIDFTETNYEFSYFDQPDVLKIEPHSGPESGGTEVRIFGTNFSNHTFSKEFLCTFTPVEGNIPAKSIPARYENNTSVLCLSPGGWGVGTAAFVRLTFNGQDASQSEHIFYFYNIVTAEPLSGPADGRGGLITVTGNGFSNSTTTFCKLDNELYKPYSVSAN